MARRKGATKERLDRLWRRLRGKAWQIRNGRKLAGPRQKAGLVWFAMPLVSKRRAQDWAGVEARLAVTIRALLAQTDPRWSLTICGQDRPSNLPDDPRIHFLEAKISDRFNDQREKGELMTADLMRRANGAGYYVKHDADDVLHPGFVEYVLTDDNGQGYLVDEGFILDAGVLEEEGRFKLGSLGRPHVDIPLRKPFFTACGTCAAFWYDADSGADFKKLLDRRGSHHLLLTNLADFGFALDFIPFPAAIYVTNHGNNMRQRRGKQDYMVELVDRHEVKDPEPVVAEFGLRKLFDQPN